MQYYHFNAGGHIHYQLVAIKEYTKFSSHLRPPRNAVERYENVGRIGSTEYTLPHLFSVSTL